ncbi:hypothetical protein EG329_006004 [Mollisiaceae sp. DMI_Dod_QoI]|nr:hypothetical protein EG329_006004 [Helotiales sp. DMI_Dod_QoI]
MATDILILSSSPPRQFAAYHLSSSPPLPSMDEILQKRPQSLRTGSRAAAISQNASASFSSAALLLKSAPSADAIRAFASEDDTTGEVKPAKVAKPRKVLAKKVEGEEKTKKIRKPAATDGDAAVGEKKKTTKPRAKKAVEDGAEILPKIRVAPKPRTKKADKDNSGNGVDQEKPARKPRVKKATTDSQTKLLGGKVTKASATAATKLEKAPKPQEAKAVVEPQELDLPKALKRRADWTPPELDRKTAGHSVSDNSLSSSGLLSGQKRNGFADLFGSYGFTKMENSSALVPVATDIPRKRKLIELVKTNLASVPVAPPKEKEKAPKKKARTITDQATSAYTEEGDLPVQPAPLLQYFSLQTSERPGGVGFKVPPRPRSKSPVKATSKSKKGSAQEPILLLSPESAMKQVGNQDFVFGTSSQLAREDSPTLLRDLHAAMQASNEDDDPFADSIFDSSPPVPRRTTGLTTKRNLWSAASRDDLGELLDVPMIDLVDSPVVNNQKLITSATAATPLPAGSEIWHDIGPTPAANDGPVEAKIRGPIEAAIRNELLSSPSGSRGVKSPKASKTTTDDGKPQSLKSSRPKSPGKGKIPSSTQMPNFAAYTDAQLAKEIASYHFKPVKKREQMITLLERCWTSKNQPILGDLSNNLPIAATKTFKDVALPTQPAKTSPKRPRGRPRKESIVQYLEMDSDMPLSHTRTPKKVRKKVTETSEEISDSDTLATPSPPRRSASQITPLVLRPPTSNMSSPELSPGAAQELLFKHISRAVTSAPRSKDPLDPSWHEKILLYDPIVLEDLTVWLNTGALEKVGWDGEVDPKLVKKWCESKSICCLWRENLRGGARNRY